MSNENGHHVCPVEKAGGLDNSVRRFLQNPRKILSPYIERGMTVLDLGCGPGVFTLEIAHLLKDSGKVIAADLQDGMLEKVKYKIKNTDLEQRVELHKCQDTSIGIKEKVDFILAFYMIHEVPSQEILFKEFQSILKPYGKVFIVEPKFNVSKDDFAKMINLLNSVGFEPIENPKVFFSRTVVLRHKRNL